VRTYKLRIFIDLDPIFSNRLGDKLGGVPNHSNVENGLRIVRQGHTQGVEVLKRISLILAGLALNCSRLLTYEKV